jgi:putative transposase
MKFEFMKNHANEFSIEKMSKIFNVSRSGYYQFINAKESARSKEGDRLLVLIKNIHQASRATYVAHVYTLSYVFKGKHVLVNE